MFCKGLISLAIFSSTPVLATQYIDSCGTTITQSGVYHLAQDLDCSGQPHPTGIKVLNASKVRIEMKGHQMRGRPSAAYGGQGSGIWIINSSQVEIDGTQSASRMYNWAAAIRIQGSSQVKIDGDNMLLENNANGVHAQNVDRLLVKQLRLANKQRDVYLSDSNQSRIEKTRHLGPALQGILLTQSENMKLDHIELKQPGAVQRGIILFNSRRIEIDDSDLFAGAVAVVLQGQGTQAITIKDSKLDAQCDLQTSFGAQPAVLEDVAILTEC